MLSYHLFRGAILRAQGKPCEAIVELGKVIAAEKELAHNTLATLNGVVPYAYLELSSAHLDARHLPKAAEALKKAEGITGYDLYRALQVRIHAAKGVLAKAQAAASASSS